MLFNDTWYQAGHSASCMAKHYVVYANHQFRYQATAVSLVIINCHFNLLWGLCGYVYPNVQIFMNIHAHALQILASS